MTIKNYEIIFDNLINLYRHYNKTVKTLTGFSTADIFECRDDFVTTNLDTIRDKVLQQYVWEQFHFPEICDDMYDYTDNYFDDCCYNNQSFSLEDLNNIIIRKFETSIPSLLKD